MKIVSTEQMRALDRTAIQERGIPGLALMENAGRTVAEAAYRLTERNPTGTIVALCGKGSNGGDGFVAAHYLARFGRRVQVFLAAPKGSVAGDARANLTRLEQAGLTVTEIEKADAVAIPCRNAALLIDALLGTGLTGEVRGLPADLIRVMNDSGTPIVAVDIPSGLSSDTGAPLGQAVLARETVTMGLPKIGLYLYPGMDYAGRVTVADIGYPRELVQQIPAVGEVTEAAQVASCIPARERSANKGDFGRLLIIAGSVGMTGAAALCAEAALRAGAGLVYVGCPASLNDLLEVKLTEAITVPLPQTEQRSLHSRGLQQILDFSQRVDAVALGPGVGRHPETASLIRQLVGKLEKPVVIDADGLNACSEEPSVLEGAHAPLVLTPHPGEMSRLLGLGIPEIQARRLEAAQTAAERFHSTVLLKGACSLIAELGKTLRVNPTGNPGLATGGTGDVLTGLILALIGQGAPPFEAAAAGAYLHGLAGDLAADRLGRVSLIAGDLLAALPQAILQVTGGDRDSRVESRE